MGSCFSKPEQKYQTAEEVDDPDSMWEVGDAIWAKGPVALMEGIVATARGPRPSIPADFGKEDPDDFHNIHKLDTALLSASPMLQGVYSALPQDMRDATVLDLLAAEVPFASAPNPKPLFEKMSNEHKELPPLEGNATALKILTFNCGLLSRSHPLGHVSVPDYLTRRKYMWNVLFSRGDDILLLTEVFEKVDVDEASKVAAAKGYRIYAGTSRLAPGQADREYHGLMIAMKMAFCVKGSVTRERWFDAQFAKEFSPGPSLKRGFLCWQFVHPHGDQPMAVVCAHCTAMADNVLIRTLQFRQLGIYIRKLPAECLVFAGGDLNAAPYYPTDKWYGAKKFVLKDKTKPISEDNLKEAVKKEYNSYWECATSYPIFLHYSGAVDLMSCREPAKDVENMEKLKPNYANAWKHPYGMENCASEVGTDVMTATDLNSLHKKNYGKKCYRPGRYDYLFCRDAHNKAGNPAKLMRVEKAGLTLKEESEEYTKDKSPVTLSDHFGVEATVNFVAGEK